MPSTLVSRQPAARSVRVLEELLPLAQRCMSSTCYADLSGLLASRHLICSAVQCCYALCKSVVQRILSRDGQVLDDPGKVPEIYNQLGIGDLLIHVPPWAQIAKDLLRESRTNPQAADLLENLLQVSAPRGLSY